MLEIMEGKENDIYYAQYSWYVICVQSSRWMNDVASLKRTA
jgi:hypothetical protein